MRTSTVQMKKSSGSGDRPRPTSFFPGADFAWAMGVQPNQTPQKFLEDKPHPRNQAPRSTLVSANQRRSRALEEETLIKTWMDGSG